ncbi:MAG: Methylated-DNA/protein-cysteine methyltransferase [Parcubacteria group bacterium GW2011_GWB1_46_8]|nr:MAG: Methylated-DNA/protein-cysteine methyltransferase [Parcubacteria group bacterium GW2011_GWF1_45_5]KKU10714.1 MAG: Methylated-DNA/protein-cysteine methyltransferase [Parcubacteria group bacterium GW2011_GWA1_45_7]KKU43189.1 MAG: Methylated-DNA/protein-cysteine methyltransferase [Parcubacteria group bacterium GW2011_GWA2_46_7]KKU46477.1 MAG: Methylated-DNA/protein-cysteine methyltransferase [Parcubacteria group bacterium GW2011_GWB1_46_8]
MANYARTGGKPGKPAYRTPSRLAHPFNRFSQLRPSLSGFMPKEQKGYSGSVQRHGFFSQAQEMVKKIPKGKVATYGQIANMIGTKDARKVGWALHDNTDPKVPCQRVVNKDGGIALNYGWPGGWKEQRRRLLAEGIGFTDEMHVDITKYLWNP